MNILSIENMKRGGGVSAEKLYRNREFLNQKCIIENLPDFQVADLIGCSESSIARYRLEHGLLRKKVNKNRNFQQLNQLLSASDTIKAAAAGFCDGDGCLSISKVKRRRSSNWSYTLTTIFSQAWYKKPKREILLSIQSYYGGHIHVNEKTYCAQLRIGFYQSISLIREMRPYLTVRKEQADLALEFHEIKGRGYPPGCKQSYLDSLEDCKINMHYLNRSGEYAFASFEEIYEKYKEI